MKMRGVVPGIFEYFEKLPKYKSEVPSPRLKKKLRHNSEVVKQADESRKHRG